MMSKSLVLLCAPNQEAANEIIKGITKQNELPAGCSDATIPKYEWVIVNKYYTANVMICPTTDPKELDDEFLKTVEAIIIYIKNSEGDTFESAKRWESVLAKTVPQTKILICDKCNEDVPKAQALPWCLDNAFELVDLSEKANSEEETLFKEEYGIERVINTLHSHIWNGYTRIDASEIQPNAKLSYFDDQETDDEDLSDQLDQFCTLFSKLSDSRRNADDLEPEHRKAYAEHVVKAFWKAIGGNMDELGDLE